MVPEGVARGQLFRGGCARAHGVTYGNPLGEEGRASGAGPGGAAQSTQAGSLVNGPAKLHTKPQGSWKEENAHIPATSRSDASESDSAEIREL